MKAKDVDIGRSYICKVSDKLTTVKVIAYHGERGYLAVNTATGRHVYLRTAARLRGPAVMRPRV